MAWCTLCKKSVDGRQLIDNNGFCSHACYLQAVQNKKVGQLGLKMVERMQKSANANQQQQRKKELQAKWESRECPECAEMVKRKAKVCRYCSYRFEDRDAVVAEMKKEEEEAARMGCEPWEAKGRKAAFEAEQARKKRELETKRKELESKAKELGCSVENVPRVLRERKERKEEEEANKQKEELKRKQTTWWYLSATAVGIILGGGVRRKCGLDDYWGWDHFCLCLLFHNSVIGQKLCISLIRTFEG